MFKRPYHCKKINKLRAAATSITATTRSIRRSKIVYDSNREFQVYPVTQHMCVVCVVIHFNWNLSR